MSQEAGEVVWYSHLFKYFPQFIVTYTVKGFGMVNKAEVDVFLELSENLGLDQIEGILLTSWEEKPSHDNPRMMG